MTNPISQYGRLGQPEGFSRSTTEKTDKKTGSLAASDSAGESATLSLGAATAPTPPRASDVVSLSNVAERVKAEPDFDRAKVDAIKHAIQNGQYPLNPRRIAESFVAIEQMIRD
jgi:negative regulator of flagellin synthesis FlgM